MSAWLPYLLHVKVSILPLKCVRASLRMCMHTCLVALCKCAHITFRMCAGELICVWLHSRHEMDPWIQLHACKHVCLHLSKLKCSSTCQPNYLCASVSVVAILAACWCASRPLTSLIDSLLISCTFCKVASCWNLQRFFIQEKFVRREKLHVKVTELELVISNQHGFVCRIVCLLTTMYYMNMYSEVIICIRLLKKWAFTFLFLSLVWHPPSAHVFINPYLI